MKKRSAVLACSVAFALAGCGSNFTPSTSSALPPPPTNFSVPASIVATSGYTVSVLAEPTSSTKPDSVVQIGNSIFVGFGDTVNPDGTPGPTGQTSVEIVQLSLGGLLQKTWTVPGHNDGLMAFDSSTLWAMSNEDGNPTLSILNVATGTQHVYVAQPSLLSGGFLPTGGGIDDMQVINGNVYVSASNPTPNAAAACPANSSTPGCPNGVSTVPFVYQLSLNGDGATFNLTPVVTSNTPAMNMVTNVIGTINATDPDSETIAPDGSTLIVDSQQDSELAFISNVGSTPSIGYLPLTSGGAPQQVDDTRFVPSSSTFLILTDTPSNTIYRIDGPFKAGDAYSAGQTALMKLNTSTGVLTPVVSGFKAPHGLLFVTAH